jgi:sarcosine oxidase, subunit gamma
VTAEAALESRRSPLGATTVDPFPVASGPGVEIRERPFLAQVLLRLTPTDEARSAVGAALGLDLPTTSRLTRSAGTPRLAIWLAPDEWLVVDAGDASALERAIGAAASPHGGTVVDVSAHRTLLELSGPGVRDLLACGTSIDLHPRVFDVGAAAQTQLARVDVIIGRGSEDTYHVAVRASFARYLLDWLRATIEAEASDQGDLIQEGST